MPARRALNGRARLLNAQRSRTRSHRPSGTSRGSCSSWITAAPAPKEPPRRMTIQLLTPRLARRPRDAAGTEPTARGPSAAAPAALGRLAAPAAPATQPHRPTHARRPAPALLTPYTSRTDQTCRAAASQQPSRSRPHLRRCLCRPPAWERQQVARHRPACAAAATLPRVLAADPKPGRKEPAARVPVQGATNDPDPCGRRPHQNASGRTWTVPGAARHSRKA